MNLKIIAACVIVPLAALAFVSLRAQTNDAKLERMKYLETNERLSEQGVKAALENAIQSRYAVVLFHYDWSIYSAIAKRDFRIFVDRYCARHPESPVLFHEVNLTNLSNGRSFIQSIPGWSSIVEDIAETLPMFYGDGNVVWLRDGQFFAIENSKYNWNPKRLTRNTMDLLD